jgi:hypothetical protein
VDLSSACTVLQCLQLEAIKRLVTWVVVKLRHVLGGDSISIDMF